MEDLRLGNRSVGPNHAPYIIAEIGSNHNGDMDLARKLVRAAKEAGADAVKFQSWSKRSLICREEYERNTAYADKKRHFGSLEEMVEKYQLTPEQHREIAAFCRKEGIAFVSSPFAPEEVDLLVSLDVPFLKVASMDINHLPLLAHMASTGKPLVISTGMATLAEIERAMDTLRKPGCGPVALLHCVSLYPPDMEKINLRNIDSLRRTFGVPVGFSDHTIGTAIPLAATALGAAIIEKHFTLDKDMEGWDHWVSANPEELAIIVRESRNIFLALGSERRVVTDAEIRKTRDFRRSIVTRRAMKAGERITADCLDFKRPGSGIRPDELRYVLGRTLGVDVEEDAMLTWEQLR